MRVLLDTNIVIHRENHYASNYSIGHLYKWIDKLKYDKFVHEFSLQEVCKYSDDQKRLEALMVKLEAYEILESTPPFTSDFNEGVAQYSMNDNDIIDNTLLYEVYLGRVDILVTEDKKMLNKGKRLGIESRVFTINQFISLLTSQNPELIDYGVLEVKKMKFGDINLKSPFFDTFRRDYNGFDKWFYKKCNEYAYVCEDEKDILGFLYIKVEDEKEVYSDIKPIFCPKKRLKIGTFKVESTGFRLGERFVKIIFENALQYNVEEIYVTMFEDRDEIQALNRLLCGWGFKKFGQKESESGAETVLVKVLNKYSKDMNPRKNFPNIIYTGRKYILPIMAQYHTTLMPDSHLHNENLVDLLERKAHQYALQKVYISKSFERSMEKGDYLLFYRMGTTTPKKFSSVITTLGIIEEVKRDFASKDDYLTMCQNRTVFDETTKNKLWNSFGNQLVVVRFIVVKELTKKVTLDALWQMGIIQAPNGPRPFTQITDDQFNSIIRLSETELNFIEEEKVYV